MCSTQLPPSKAYEICRPSTCSSVQAPRSTHLIIISTISLKLSTTCRFSLEPFVILIFLVEPVVPSFTFMWSSSAVCFTRCMHTEYVPRPASVCPSYCRPADALRGYWSLILRFQRESAAMHVQMLPLQSSSSGLSHCLVDGTAHQRLGASAIENDTGLPDRLGQKRVHRAVNCQELTRSSYANTTQRSVFETRDGRTFVRVPSAYLGGSYG
ncbi:hypothetical protein SCLCIDRAFT_1042767 [Scleroderma citrinum Foug A]|uniref:Uncharacterized protein n=1 Tax=Scleroderma citrinum Foug A TaxID=1036808 RepID=A0A0C2ZAX2_9AGAM|nr:hypothetical protein SCLCIDRAFT_1042767 [Scleroderma citrinum Foug A]